MAFSKINWRLEKLLDYTFCYGSMFKKFVKFLTSPKITYVERKTKRSQTYNYLVIIHPYTVSGQEIALKELYLLQM